MRTRVRGSGRSTYRLQVLTPFYSLADKYRPPVFTLVAPEVSFCRFFVLKRTVVEQACNVQDSVFITYFLINPPLVLGIGHDSPSCHLPMSMECRASLLQSSVRRRVVMSDDCHFHNCLGTFSITHC